MKPLELNDYGWCRVDTDGTRVFHGPNKRLTGAELAAEVLYATLGDVLNVKDGKHAQLLLSNAKTKTMERFATTPSYDE